MAIIVAASVIGACSTAPKKKKTATDTSQAAWKTYSNEFFELDYPPYMHVDEEVNDMCDTIPSLSRGIRVTLYSTLPGGPYHDVCVQKSGMFDAFTTPEGWRDLSVQLKGLGLDDRYIGNVEGMMLDSLHFGPYPAAMAGFGVVENGDTLIHKQLVVMVGKEVYYLNNTYYIHDTGTLQQLGDSILSTIRFKSAKP